MCLLLWAYFTSVFFGVSFLGGDLGVSFTEGIFFSGARALFPPPTPPRGGRVPRGDEFVTCVENELFSKALESGVRSGPSCLATGVGFDSSELGIDSSRSSVLSVGVGVSDLSTDTYKDASLKNVPWGRKSKARSDPPHL